MGPAVLLVITRGVDSVDGSFSSFWRATLLCQHMQTRANMIKFRCQHVVYKVIMRPGNSCGRERLEEGVLGYETKLSVCSGWLLNNWEASYKCQ